MIVGGGAIPMHINFSIAYGLRIYLLHKSLQPLAQEVIIVDSLSHDQIGIGTGEDLVFFCYLWERLYNGYVSLAEIMDANAIPAQISEENTRNASSYLNGWDIDEHALNICRGNLIFTSERCKIEKNDVFKLDSFCQSTTATTTAPVNHIFLIQTLLYVLGGQRTKYYIFDETGNGEQLFEVIRGAAELMGYSRQYAKSVIKAAKISKANTGKSCYTKDAFYEPFMAVLLATSNEASEDRRDLRCLDTDAFIDWMYKYLRKPDPDTGQPEILTEHQIELISKSQKLSHIMVIIRFPITYSNYCY